MAIYFLRHGQSEANLKGLFAGQKDDSPLTDLGKEQAREAGADVKNFGITKMYASPLTRTKQTAEIVAEIIGYPAEDIIYDERLLEYDMGSMTGTLIKDAPKNREVFDGKDAEDKHAFQERAVSFLLDHEDEEGNILIVSHAGIGRIIEATRQGINPQNFYSLPPYPNARAVELDLSWLSSKVEK